MKVGEDADSELGDFIKDDVSPTSEFQAGRELLREEIERVLDSLSPREAEVLELLDSLRTPNRGVEAD